MRTENIPMPTDEKIIAILAWIAVLSFFILLFGSIIYHCHIEDRTPVSGPLELNGDTAIYDGHSYLVLWYHNRSRPPYHVVDTIIHDPNCWCKNEETK